MPEIYMSESHSIVTCETVWMELAHYVFLHYVDAYKHVLLLTR